MYVIDLAVDTTQPLACVEQRPHKPNRAKKSRVNRQQMHEITLDPFTIELL